LHEGEATYYAPTEWDWAGAGASISHTAFEASSYEGEGNDDWNYPVSTRDKRNPSSAFIGVKGLIGAGGCPKTAHCEALRPLYTRDGGSLSDRYLVTKIENASCHH